MSLTKRVSGNFTLETVAGTGQIVIRSDTGILIDGDLTVTGTQTEVQTTDLNVVDNVILLNSGETGTGITAGTAGISIDRGLALDVGIRYNESLGYWEATDDGSTWYAVNALLTGNFNLIDDLAPQLGANLDVNGFSITSAANGDVVLVANGTGLVKIDQELSLVEQLTDETPTPGYNKIYAKTPGSGETGLYVSNSTTTGELISRRKAILYSLIL